MKIVSILLFSLALIASCSPKTEPETKPESVVEQPEPTEWIQFEGQADAKKVVLIAGDEEYRSEEALPQLASILSDQHGFECTVLFSQDTTAPGVIDPNFPSNIPGLEALAEADLMVIFTRFRALPDEQMDHIYDYLLAGKPVIGIRTATHAFQYKDTTHTYYKWSNSFNDPDSPWDGGFGRLILGEKWISHHGHHKQQSTLGLIAQGAEDHPIARGINDGDIWGPTDVYGVRLPLPDDSRPIIMGQVMDRTDEYDESDPFFGLKKTDSKVANANPASKRQYNPNDPMMPVAWTKTYKLPEGKAGQSFTSTIGSSTDMANEGVRRLFVNATYYLLGMEVPEKAQVEAAGFQPSAYSFQSDEYWEQKNLRVVDQKKP